MSYEEIKKIIESCHLNFLIGSGASKPFLGTLGDIENLLTELAQTDLDEDSKTIIDASIKLHYFNVAIKGNLELNQEESNRLKSTQNSYNDFINSIHDLLFLRKSNLIHPKANLFTTNMDLFLDTTLEELNCTFSDGFSGRIKPVYGTENFQNSIIKSSPHYDYKSDVPLFNLFKLHGSLNWKVEGLDKDKVTYDYGLSILKEIHTLEIDNKLMLDIEYKEGKNPEGKDIWKTHSVRELSETLNNKKIKRQDTHSNFLSAYDKLVMINPTKEKFQTTTENLLFYELLRMYSNILEKENSVLFVIGFSFADEHLLKITNRVSLTNPTLLIIIFAFNQADEEYLNKQFLDRRNVKIIFDKEENNKDSDNYNSLAYLNQEYFLKLVNELRSPKSVVQKVEILSSRNDANKEANG